MKKWEENIRRVVPYVAGEQPEDRDVIKLNTNENPYPPSPEVIAKSREIDAGLFPLYPDTEAKVLVRELADFHKLDFNQIFVGVGSDDVLSMSFLTFFNSDKPILFPDITYSFYPVWADLYRIPYETVPVNDDFEIIPEDYQRENGGIVIANPNAPTSISLGISEIETILKENQDVIVIVDEAYVDFGGTTVLPLISKYENLLVVRTFSKSRSMAGMRIGYAMGNQRLIQALKDVKESINSYTMNTASILLGAESVKDDEYFKRHIEKVIATRENTAKELKKLGFDVKNSCTNFFFVSHKKVPAKYIFEKLREKKVYVRYFDKPRIDNYLRITVGTDEQMQQFLTVLSECLECYEEKR